VGGGSDAYKVVSKEQITINLTNLCMQRLCREALVWRHLMHPNVLSFIGLNWTLFPHDSLPMLIAPWMSCGTLRDYVNSMGLTLSYVSYVVR
jgi:hypothetical protein